MFWGSVFAHIPKQQWGSCVFWRTKKTRFFSAGVALISIILVNLAPVWAAQPTVLNPIPDQQVTENVIFNFQFAANTFNDPEHSLAYTAELAGGGALPAWLNFDANTRTFSGVPSNGDTGTVTIQVVADDGNGASASDSFDLTVISSNNAPIVANTIPDQSINEETPFSFQFAANTFFDADINDTLTYTANQTGGGELPAWLNFNAATRTFSGTPLDANVGTISIVVTADDGNGGTVTDTFIITVQNIYNPPALVRPIPGQTATANNKFNFRFAHNTFSHDTGTSLTYSAQPTDGGELPAWLEFDGSLRTFRGTPSTSDLGNISIDVFAFDNIGGMMNATFTIDVLAAQPYSGLGDGLSKETAYVITNCEQLQEMSNNLGVWYRLANNIDCSDTINWDDGAGFVPIGSPSASFLGALDGAGYTISNLTINRPTTNHVGLFGYIGAFISDSSVQQFVLSDVSVRGQNHVGGVAGESWGRVSSIGITGEVNGTDIVGGAVGSNNFMVSNVYSHTAVTGVAGSGIGGGLVGQNGGFAQNSYATGAVPAGPNKGGLIGNDLGSGGVFNSFWDIASSGIAVSSQGTGKTTAEMKNSATFTSTQTAGLQSAWDFVNNPNNDAANNDIWHIDPLFNQGYPFLIWEQTPGTPPTEPEPTPQPPIKPPVNPDTMQPNTASPRSNTTVARQPKPVAETIVNTSSSTELDTLTSLNSVPQTTTQENSNEEVENTKAIKSSSTPWLFIGILLFLFIVIYVVYRRTRHGVTE